MYGNSKSVAVWMKSNEDSSFYKFLYDFNIKPFSLWYGKMSCESVWLLIYDKDSNFKIDFTGSCYEYCCTCVPSGSLLALGPSCK